MTFKESDDANAVVEKHENDHAAELRRYRRGCCSFLSDNPPVLMRRAPEPSDILWHNLGLSKKKICCATAVNTMVILTMMFAALLIVYWFKNVVFADSGSAFIGTALIIVVNSSFMKYVKVLSKKEGH